MGVAQPFATVCTGGLDLVSSPFELLRFPNKAIKLKNFEVASQGGYRRINGYLVLGEGSATQPEGTLRVLGVKAYGEGVIACVDTSIYYSEDGITWLQVNKDTTGSGKAEGDMPATAALDRPSQGRAQFSLMTAPSGNETTTYGSLSIATGADKVGLFRIEGTGGSKTFYYSEISGVGNPAAGSLLELNDQHLCVVDTVNEPSTIYYSTLNIDSDFTGTGSGSVTIPDKIVAIKSFRKELYIFGSNTIRKLVDINGTPLVENVALNIGCVSPYTVQEMGGDLIFLAYDGIRTIAGTSRIDDIELSVLSTLIRPLIKSILNNADAYIFSSVVIRKKNQYRLFYNNTATLKAKGIIGTLRPNQETGQIAFEWSETDGVAVTAIDSSFNLAGIEVVYHGDDTGYVYQHDVGASFNGEGIEYVYETPDFDLGDPGMRKTTHYMNVSMLPESSTTISLQTKFDFNSNNIVQPLVQDVVVTASGATYGEGLYGTAIYGSGTDYGRINLIGSGTSVAFRFFGTNTDYPFIISGFYVLFVPHDRR
jgi:hypothetical protein